MQNTMRPFMVFQAGRVMSMSGWLITEIYWEYYLVLFGYKNTTFLLLKSFWGWLHCPGSLWSGSGRFVIYSVNQRALLSNVSGNSQVCRRIFHRRLLMDCLGRLCGGRPTARLSKALRSDQIIWFRQHSRSWLFLGLRR